MSIEYACVPGSDGELIMFHEAELAERTFAAELKSASPGANAHSTLKL